MHDELKVTVTFLLLYNFKNIHKTINFEKYQSSICLCMMREKSVYGRLSFKLKSWYFLTFMSYIWFNLSSNSSFLVPLKGHLSNIMWTNLFFRFSVCMSVLAPMHSLFLFLHEGLTTEQQNTENPRCPAQQHLFLFL